MFRKRALNKYVHISAYIHMWKGLYLNLKKVFFMLCLFSQYKFIFCQRQDTGLLAIFQFKHSWRWFVRASCTVSTQYRVLCTMSGEVAHGVFVQQELVFQWLWGDWHCKLIFWNGADRNLEKSSSYIYIIKCIYCAVVAQVNIQLKRWCTHIHGGATMWIKVCTTPFHGSSTNADANR